MHARSCSSSRGPPPCGAPPPSSRAAPRRLRDLLLVRQVDAEAAPGRGGDERPVVVQRGVDVDRNAHDPPGWEYRRVSLVTWLLVLAAATVLLYAVFLGGLVLFGRRGDARAVAGFIPD